jgi:hypothetical protein
MARTKNPITASQRRLRAQLANDIRWSRLPAGKRTAQTQAARDGVWAKYLTQVDPEGALPAEEREKLARQAFRADMRRRSLMASRARSAKAAARAREAATGGGSGVPRAVHLYRLGHPACGQFASCSALYAVDESGQDVPESVTCRKCLRLIAARGAQAEAAG